MATEALPLAFTLANAVASGVGKDRVYAMLAAGEIERAGRGVYVRASAVDPAFFGLIAATAVRPEATMCLTSALVFHELSDAIPFATDIALPRGTRFPAGFNHITWRSFDKATFTLGRDTVQIAEDTSAGIYSAERTIVDCFRLMHQEGSDAAHEALRRWLRRRGSSPAVLLGLASQFPKAEPRLRHALEVLL